MKKALTWVNILTFSYHQTRNSVSKHAPNPGGLRCRPVLLGSLSNQGDDGNKNKKNLHI